MRKLWAYGQRWRARRISEKAGRLIAKGRRLLAKAAYVLGDEL